MSTAYAELERRFTRISVLRGASAMLQWDGSTMMPSGSGDVRTEQLATLAAFSHEQVTDSKLKLLLDEAEAHAGKLNDWQQANLREMRRIWIHENALDAKLVEELSRACSTSELFWREARPNNDFKGFSPHLEKVLSLTRKAAQAKAEALKCSPYDALIDSYDPGLRSKDIDVWFDDLVVFLPPFVQQVMAHQEKQPKAFALPGPFAPVVQRELGLRFMKFLGFDFERGRLDESKHPFCGGVPGDVRLTTRYSDENFTESFFGVLHETGHALYELGLPAEWRNQPVGEARGMSIHESQSLFTEMQVSRTMEFLNFAAPQIREAFNGKGPAWEAKCINRYITQVKPSLIRVSADEVTYPLHIILRYRLEKALLSGDLKVADLPGAWNDGMQKLLGIVPENHSDGCMQDIHWADGAFGYFPTYTLGAMTAAQLMHALRTSEPKALAAVEKGDYSLIKEWLGKNIHRHGSRFSTPDLIRKATGKNLDVAIYKNHLQNRYLA